MGGLAAGAGMGLQIFGQIRQGQTAEAIGERNAQMAEAEAKQVGKIGEFKQRRQAQAGQRELGTMAARIGASGITGGTSIMAQAEQAAELDLENLMIGHRGAEQQRGLKSEAAMARYKGKEAKKAAYIGAAGTALTGLGGMGGKPTEKVAEATKMRTLTKFAKKKKSWLDEPVGGF